MDSIWNESAMRQYVNRETVENLLLPENVFECNCSFSSEDKVKIESLTDDFTSKLRKRISLWFFILELLDLDKYQTCLGWTYEEPYEFEIKNPDELAALWGSVKDNSTMTYSKFTRGLRYYYGKKIIEKVPDKPYTYKFVLSKRTEVFLSRFDFTKKAW